MPKTPTILTIDTATTRTVVGVFRRGVLAECRGTVRRADDLLPLTHEALHKSGVTLTDLSGIVVRQGLGSYTGLRVGVTVATTLGWSLGIPVLGHISRRQTPTTVPELARALAKLPHPKTDSWPRLIPKYAPWPARARSATMEQSA